MKCLLYGGLVAAILSAIFSVGSAESVPGDKPTSASVTKSTQSSLGPALSPSEIPLKFVPRERIALVGNSLAERMNLFGNFESLLHTRFPQAELVVRNFARPCDAVENRQRPNSYTDIDDPLQVFRPDTFICFFGLNESFAGPEGEDDFRANYVKFLDEITQKYPRDQKGSKPRLVLVSPVAWEPTGNRLWPNADERNRFLKRYSQIVAEVARDRGLAFAELFSPTLPLFTATPGMQFTINGCHLNEAGDREVARILDHALFGSTTAANMDSPEFQKLRAAVNDKSWLHLQDYRMLNGWYVYGGRRTFDTDTFPREYEKIRAMVALRDSYVASLAQGKSTPPPDDSITGELEIPATRFGVPTQSYSEPKELRYLTPEECAATMKVPEGFEVQPFASEREFPELAKPDQLNFDNRGRCWVCCMPTYPQWKPGDPRPNDRLLILEDTNHDGRADKCTVFYDKLHCPTGFEFWNGGVIVGNQPRLTWLKDTDGDDKADLVIDLIDGWASDDTHHSVGKFEYSNGGLLHTLEGISMSTTVETPWGPFRRKDAPGAYILDPRTLKLSHFVTPGYGNPWCYVFDSWGQGIVGDGTTAQQHWDSPLSGAEVSGRRGMNPIFDNQGMRPCVGSEFLLTRQFPEVVQGQFTYSCVINMNGMPRFNIREQEAGYIGERAMQTKSPGEPDAKPQPDDLLASTDKAFRPVDAQIGPDGALWFGDWANAIIGHMQYSQRDPNRDHQHGRIYRLVYKNKELLEPVTQFDKTTEQLLEQLRAYEPRTRYRARRELRDRPTPVVTAAVKKWVAALDPKDTEYDRLSCEALWVQQGHHAVDSELLRAVLAANTPQARAAAMHIVADEREYLTSALELMISGIHDDNPRVRLEAVRGLSFMQSLDAVEAALAVLEKPVDAWISYTLDHTIMALEPVWTAPYQQSAFAENEGAQKYLDDFLFRQRPGLVAQPHIKVLLNPDITDAARVRAYASLEGLHGNSANGEAVFRRVCAGCHKAKDIGFSFGPELTDVSKRLSRHDLVESIIEPSKKLDPKFVTTTIITGEGKPEVGFIAEKNEDSITLLMAEGKRKTFAMEDIEEMAEMKQSSMPENLAATLAPEEFLDIVEYLSTLK